MKALIVDDEPTVRLLMTRILRREVDCAVAEATNGIEALDLLSRQHFDFVVLDVMMPIMDGLETLEAIRRTPELRSMPVMVLSAIRDESQVRRLVTLGISAYLIKPLRPADASERVAKFIASLGTRMTAAAGSGEGRTVTGLPDNSQILVVDGDQDFRHFVKSTLGHRYLIAEAEGGAQGLRVVIANSPALILLGQDLGPIPPDMFLRKLRALPHGGDIPVVVAGRATETPDGADGVIQRTFIPDVFRKQFAELVLGGTAEQRTISQRPQIRPQMISATEQVFGMMLNVEVLADAVAPPPPSTGDDLVTLTLKLAHSECHIEVGLTVARAASERMTIMFLQGALDVVGDEDIAGTLQELANIISGRLQNALRTSGDDVAMGLPTVGVVPADFDFGNSSVVVAFHDAGGDLRFTAFARAVPADAGGSRAAVA